MCNGWCNGCEHSSDWCKRHNPEQLRECSVCGELVNADEGQYNPCCGTAYTWTCDDCGQWQTIDGYVYCGQCAAECAA